MSGYAIRLDSHDLAKVRLGRLHPLWELEDAAHLRVATSTSMAKRWLATSQLRMDGRGPQTLRDLRSGAVQYSAYGVSPADGETDFEACLETALRAPDAKWRELLGGIRASGWHLPCPGLAAGLSQLERSTRHFFEAAVAPYWAAANAEADRATSAWREILAFHGLGTMLDSLHREITWRPPYLIVDTRDPDVLCPPGCVHLALEARPTEAGHPMPPIPARPSQDGLMIMPTVFGQTCMIQGKPEAVEVLAVPVPVRPSIFDNAPGLARPAEKLLGPTRSWVLQACAQHELTTGNLSRNVGLSISSASEHAKVLRNSGLLSSRRDGHSVVHYATELGRRLLSAEGPDDDLPARRYFAIPPDRAEQRTNRASDAIGSHRPESGHPSE